MMKKFRILMLALLVASIVALVGCDNPEKMKDVPQESLPKMEPNPLVLVGKTVNGKITGRFAPKYFNKKAKLEMTPVIKYQGGELVLPSKIYQGESVTENHTVVGYESGAPYAIDFAFDYKPEMMQSQVELRLTLHYSGKKVPFDASIPVGIGVNETQNLADLAAQPIFAAHNFERNREASATAQINFPIQSADIRSGELTKEDVAKLTKAIKDISLNQKEALMGIEISSYASPDGPVQLNENLSKSRGKTTQEWLNKTLRQNKLPMEKVSVVEQNTDWSGFESMVKASNIEDKELILRVLQMYSDPDVRNREMHNLGKVFQVLAVDILPKLRRSQMKASIAISGRTDDEIKAVIDAGNIATLSINEALYGVTLYPASEQAQLYEQLLKGEPEVRVMNNLAALYLMQGIMMDEAKELLNKALGLAPNEGAVLNNLGVIEMRSAKPEEAEKYFVRATNAGEGVYRVAVRENLGACAILKGAYADAVEYLSGTNSFNQGLAMLLSNRYESAKNIFTPLKSPKAYYGLAIIGARNSDELVVIDNLRNAFGMDAKMKERAMKDVEFTKYKMNEAFVSLTK